MKRYVLDSYTILAYSGMEAGAQTVTNIFKKALANEAEIYMSVINWGETYYIILREGGEQKAELYRLTFARYPIIVDIGH